MNTNMRWFVYLKTMVNNEMTVIYMSKVDTVSTREEGLKLR